MASVERVRQPSEAVSLECPEPLPLNAQLHSVGDWWIRPENRDYYQYDCGGLRDSERWAGRLAPATVSAFSKKNITLGIIESGKLAPGVLAAVKEELLGHCVRDGRSSMFKVLNQAKMRTRNGDEFLLVTLGSKGHERIAYWKELYQEEPVRVTELLVALDTTKRNTITSLQLGFTYQCRSEKKAHVGTVRLDGLGSAACPINSSINVHEDYRGRLFGTTIVALGFQRALEVLGEDGGVVGESIDSPHMRKVFEQLGFSAEYRFGHGGSGTHTRDTKPENRAYLQTILPTRA